MDFSSILFILVTFAFLDAKVVMSLSEDEVFCTGIVCFSFRLSIIGKQILQKNIIKMNRFRNSFFSFAVFYRGEFKMVSQNLGV